MSQFCPICNKRVPKMEKYPNYICSECVDNAEAPDGKSLEIFNRDGSGGLVVKYKASDLIYEKNSFLIDGIECYAQETRFSGIIVQKSQKSLFPFNLFRRKHEH